MKGYLGVAAEDTFDADGFFRTGDAGSVDADGYVHWEGRRIAYTDPCSGTGGGPTESPFVVERDARFYLFIGPDWQGMLDALERTGTWDPACYRGTRVLESDDPFTFDLDGQVGFLDTHAAEVIVDDDGSEWVSHCG